MRITRGLPIPYYLIIFCHPLLLSVSLYGAWANRVFVKYFGSSFCLRFLTQFVIYLLFLGYHVSHDIYAAKISSFFVEFHPETFILLGILEFSAKKRMRLQTGFSNWMNLSECEMISVLMRTFWFLRIARAWFVTCDLLVDNNGPRNQASSYTSQSFWLRSAFSKGNSFFNFENLRYWRWELSYTLTTLQ